VGRLTESNERNLNILKPEETIIREINECYSIGLEQKLSRFEMQIKLSGACQFLEEQNLLIDWHVSCDVKDGLITPTVLYKENRLSEIKEIEIKRFERTKKIKEILK
jgi:hypothetical protein